MNKIYKKRNSHNHRHLEGYITFNPKSCDEIKQDPIAFINSLNTSHKRVLFEIARESQGKYEFRMPQSILAEICGMTTGTVYRIRKEFESKGIIQTRYVFGRCLDYAIDPLFKENKVYFYLMEASGHIERLKKDKKNWPR